MSVRGVFIWTCICGVEVQKEGYGLPPKWRAWHDRAIDKIVHTCADCKPKETFSKCGPACAEEEK